MDSPSVPERPSEKQAKQALGHLRSAFLTFPFADAATTKARTGSVVDPTTPPAADESTFLTILLTAICRPSLHLAPGFIIRAPQFCGAGTGKGQLVRAIARITSSEKALTTTSPIPLSAYREVGNHARNASRP
ncbi:MAG: hypothetical protein HXX10_28010 [Rhodoplanes sp.]|uniref:hypothetical protein n=1 Tax=Rhodoplanes sp. TaxID=1968906 RepID=UPI0017DA4936|nr:hypothetical protein [Rhodoplanes sp.]NVO17885.1 hypothetical protein [Rhodoplanes sp.]